MSDFISDDSLPHDIFRIGKYRSDRLFSMEETLNFIKKNKDEILHYHHMVEGKDWKQNLEKFWNQYPDGMISFG